MQQQTPEEAIQIVKRRFKNIRAFCRIHKIDTEELESLQDQALEDIHEGMNFCQVVFWVNNIRIDIIEKYEQLNRRHSYV